MTAVEYADGRDPNLDYADELYPPMRDIEDRSEIEPRDSAGSVDIAGVRLAASNVDSNDVAHFLLIKPDPGEPDTCGGCNKEWPCPGRVGIEVVQVASVDPEQERLQAIAVNAAREALGLPPL